MRRHRLPVLLLVLLVVGTAAACGTTGRTLSDPEPGATAPPRSSSTSSSSSPTTKDAIAAFALTTDAWSPGGALPRRLTCDGEGVSPPLTIGGVPEGAVELALVVTGDATTTEWVVAGIDPATTAFAEGQVPAGAVVAADDDGQVGWTGACPDQGQGSVLYELALYALTSPSGVTEGMPADEAVDLIFGAGVAGTSILTGTYAR